MTRVHVGWLRSAFSAPATRHDKLSASFFAMVYLAAVLVWLAS